MAHYLVTGGAGFIGSHLVEEQLARGHHVTVLDNLSTGTLDNLACVRQHTRLHCEIGSVCDSSVLEPLVRDCDAVWHLAAAVGVRKIMTETLRSIDENLSASETLCRMAIRHRRPVVFTSSSEVYGRSPLLPFQEDAAISLGPSSIPRWSYACCKAVDEFRLLACAQQYRLPVVIARLFNTVGPRQSPEFGMVLPRLVRQAVAGEPLTVYGDGTQTRCFADVVDVARTLARLPECEGAFGHVFNVGSDTEVSIAELAARVRAQVDDGLPIRYIPFREAFGDAFQDVPRRVPDLTRIRALLGEVITISLDQTVGRTISYQRVRSRLASPVHAGLG